MIFIWSGRLGGLRRPEVMTPLMAYGIFAAAADQRCGGA
jgi:hypothetical protein